MGRPVEQLDNRIEVKQLKSHHRSMARDMIACGELRPTDLARIYNMRPSQISIILNSPAFVAELARLEAEVEDSICDVREDLRLLTPRAKVVITEELYQDPKPNDDGKMVPLTLQERKLRLSTAFDVLDRDSGKKKHGESAAKEIHHHYGNELHIVKQMTTEDLAKNVFDLIEREE